MFTNKTIPKLVNEPGNLITDKNQILSEEFKEFTSKTI
jgi:hypothetical protein